MNQCSWGRNRITYNNHFPSPHQQSYTYAPMYYYPNTMNLQPRAAPAAYGATYQHSDAQTVPVLVHDSTTTTGSEPEVGEPDHRT
ncbi:hypothetical protein HK097_000713, partial [Rhizophlyctis rosea]